MFILFVCCDYFLLLLLCREHEKAKEHGFGMVDTSNTSTGTGSIGYTPELSRTLVSSPSAFQSPEVVFFFSSRKYIRPLQQRPFGSFAAVLVYLTSNAAQQCTICFVVLYFCSARWRWQEMMRGDWQSGFLFL